MSVISEVNDIKSFFKGLEDKTEEYHFIDTHALNAITKQSMPSYVSTETKVTMWAIGLFILISALVIFVLMIPIRLYADIKFVFCDIIRKLEK